MNRFATLGHIAAPTEPLIRIGRDIDAIPLSQLALDAQVRMLHAHRACSVRQAQLAGVFDICIPGRMASDETGELEHVSRMGGAGEHMRNSPPTRPAIRIHASVHEFPDHGRLLDRVSRDDDIRCCEITGLISRDEEFPDRLEGDGEDVAAGIHGTLPKLYLDAYTQKFHGMFTVEGGGELAETFDIADMLEALQQAAERLVLHARLI